MRARILAGVAITLTIASSPAGGVADFGDVAAGTFYAEAVQWMVDEEITTGTAPGCFDPHGVVTRGQAAAFMWRMEGSPPAAAHGFHDVAADWQQEAVSWMAATGVTTGTSATTYSPEAPLTRGQLAALLWRLARNPVAPAHPFVDVVAPWQHEAVSWMAATGITTGTSASTFSPDDFVTRAQVATFFWRYAGSPETTVDPASPPCGGASGTDFGRGAVDLLAGEPFEGWQVANPTAADVIDVDRTVDGSLVIVPRALPNNGWYGSSQGPMVYQELTGDFAVAIRIRVVSIDDPTGQTPPGAGYNSGGFVVRSVADPGDWVMYNVGSQTTSSGFAREVKTTVDHTSELQLLPTDFREYGLLVCRVGSELRYFHGDEGANWAVESIQHTRDDLSGPVQVGIVANAWEGGPRASVQVDAVAFGEPDDAAACVGSVGAI